MYLLFFQEVNLGHLAWSLGLSRLMTSKISQPRDLTSLSEREHEGEEKRSERGWGWLTHATSIQPWWSSWLEHLHFSSHDNPNYAGPDYNTSLQQPWQPKLCRYRSKSSPIRPVEYHNGYQFSLCAHFTIPVNSPLFEGWGRWPEGGWHCWPNKHVELWRSCPWSRQS